MAYFSATGTSGGGGETYEKALIPHMTSNNTPSGEAYANHAGIGYEAYKAFDGNLTTNIGTSNHGWLSTNSSSAGDYVQYKLTEAKIINKLLIRWCLQYGATVKLQGSNDNSNYVDISDTITLAATGLAKTSEQQINLTVSNNYLYYRLLVISGNVYNGYGIKFQLYGKVKKRRPIEIPFLLLTGYASGGSSNRAVYMFSQYPLNVEGYNTLTFDSIAFFSASSNKYVYIYDTAEGTTGNLIYSATANVSTKTAVNISGLSGITIVLNAVAQPDADRYAKINNIIIE